MSRYIDADALKAKYEQMLPEIGDGYHKETLQDVLFELEYAPTISPDEVRGVGEWIDKQYSVKCSFCHTEFDSEVTCCDIYGWPWKFCPNCGSLMRKSPTGCRYRNRRRRIQTMADILIRMEMPKDCGKCFVGDRTICADGCVLIELPEHGDLIEAEPIKKFITDGLNNKEFGYDTIQVLTEIEYAPVIVPSNKEETE